MAIEKIDLLSNKREAKKATGGDYVFVVEAVDAKGATIKNVDNDTVAIQGNAADYIVKATGAGVIVTKNLDGLTGAELKAAKQFKLTITLQKENAKKGVDAGVVKLAFADGSVDLTRDGKNIVVDGTDIVISKKAKDAAALEIVNAGETFDNQVTADDNGGQPGQSFTLTASADSVNEDGSVTYTVTASKAVTEATDVVFTLVPGSTTAADQGTATTNLNDFGQGAFNPVTVTIPVNGTTATFTITPPNDDKTELAESFSVQAVVAGTTLTKTATLLDGTSGGGKTYTLTKSVQSLTGTSGNDTFIAGDEGGSATLNAGDQITGGAGTDTLKLYNAAGALNAANFALATISGVENVEATLSATAQTLDVSGNADVKKVSLVNGFDGVVTLKAAQTAGLSGTISTTGAAVSFAFSDVTGGADSVNLELNNAVLKDSTPGTKGLTIAGVETLNIAATGTNALGDLLTANTTKMVITGAGSLSATLSQAAGLTKTIDGSAATGNLTIDNKAAAAAVESIKTGSGNDIYTTVYANLTKDDVIDLGTGTDSLRFSDSATFNDAATKARLEKVAGVEQLGVVTTATTLTVDGDFVAQTSYYVAGATTNAVLTNIANNADITFGKTDVATNITGVNTIGMKLGANTLNVNLDGAKDGAAVVGGLVGTVGDGLTVTGSATINVKSTGTDGQPNNVLDLTAADNQSVVVTGSQNLTLTATNAGTVTGFSIDGSAFTGKLTVTGTGSADIIKGGSGDDVITGGAGADILTGGAGKDKFVISAIKAGATLAASDADVITDFVSKTDTIALAGATASLTLTKATAAVADFAAALAAADTALGVTGTATAATASAQQVGADTYVFISNAAGAGAEHVVKLVGVSLAGIDAADFVAA